MFRCLAIFLSVVFSTPSFSTDYNSFTERLTLTKSPSTYLQACEAIAYIYKTPTKLTLAIRAAKKCSQIHINGKRYSMDKRLPGFQFDKTIHASSDILVTVQSKNGRTKSNLIIGIDKQGHRNHPTPHHDSPHQNHEHGTTGENNREGTKRPHRSQSLIALRACSETFSANSMKEYCHDSLKESKFDAETIAGFCSSKAGSRQQKSCLDDSVSFTYAPIPTMKSCSTKFLSSTSRKRCVDLAKRYQSDPVKVIEKCTSISMQNSKQLECIERFSSEKNPIKKINVLSSCKNSVQRSDVEACFEQVSKIRKKPLRVLEACKNSFFQSKSKIQCLTLSKNIKGGNAVEVIKTCSKNYPSPRRRLACIEKIALN